MTTRISPLLLPVSTASPVYNVEVFVDGVRAVAGAGLATAQGSDPQVFAQISPLILTGPLRAEVQSTGVNVDVTITGAQIKCQVQELLGANATITPDAAVTVMRAKTADIVESRDDNLVLNADATTEVPVNNEIDPVSGFRSYPSELVQRWDGQWVRKESLDPRHPQEFAGRARSGEGNKGGVSPEPSDNFLAASVSPEDL